MRIGNGHIMRCLSLADKLRERGCGVRFACRNWPGHPGSMVQQRGFKVLWIDAGLEKAGNTGPGLPGSLKIPAEQDAACCKALVSDLEIDWLIVDHYGIDQGWHKSLRGQVGRIMVIDDLADRDYDCDLLLDQAYGRNCEDYVARVPGHCALLLGSEYALLRPEFAQLRFGTLRQRCGRNGVERILVSMGGSDPDNLSSRVLEGLNRVDWTITPRVDCILGPGFQHGEEVRRIAEDHVARINIVENGFNMAEYMQNADLAVGAGGMTAWERCCLGLPALTLQLADNQSFVISNLLAAGAIRKLKTGRALSESVTRQVSECLKEPEQLDSMSLAASRVTRGLGTELVASRLVPRYAKDGGPVLLRPAEVRDMEVVHSWQLHEDTRRFSHNSDAPSLEEHSRWYYDKLKDPNGYFFIVLHGGLDAGVLRLDRVDSDRSQLLISIYTAPGHYRQGVARCVLEYAISMFPWADLVADVLPQNTASQSLFGNVGFKQVSKDRYVFAATSQG